MFKPEAHWCEKFTSTIQQSKTAILSAVRPENEIKLVAAQSSTA